MPAKAGTRYAATQTIEARRRRIVDDTGYWIIRLRGR
jgi:hypothetical protein